MSFGLPDDWLTMKDVAKAGPLDPEGPEAKQLERRISDISSQNLAQMARTLLMNRYDEFHRTSPAA